MDEKLKAFEWDRLLWGLPDELYYLEIALRVIIVFLFITTVMRILGRRGQKNITPLQQVILIATGTSIGDAMLYPQIPLLYTLTILLVLLGSMYSLTYLKYYQCAVEDFVSPGPLVLVKNGEICDDNIQVEKITKLEINAMLRSAGVRYIEKVEMAILETTGDLSVFENNVEIPHGTKSLLDAAENA
jgi:uncharacterized membrane protein YcaP (DUF421 family)